MKTLKEFLENWTESDIAMYYLACSLGLMEYQERFGEHFRSVKGVFAVQNELGTMLYQMLEQTTENGLLEKREDWDYRWNKSYKGYWEK